ncbi:uncharacterized protein LACBIDRAFT_331938 [Laccaria bicolor S238N-H82]|uniref:Predicted protein n=1 Tax=Laccaria bicolor (strain S238N-H82 / ATCC MYA-4686) TaxID=486041 RepID=B0DR37_LACBS|nr:uncharacterized protein LACBIDRAFT_331938 [Laccaria bicolor S238N-H82]EDR02929.1 predicted protein [Laccaria bicolor S238N-H82]|eukprot:XP_001886352.1 predicted protein [Laccaria bicolor S238N-H82]
MPDPNLSKLRRGPLPIFPGNVVPGLSVQLPNLPSALEQDEALPLFSGPYSDASTPSLPSALEQDEASPLFSGPYSDASTPSQHNNNASQDDDDSSQDVDDSSQINANSSDEDSDSSSMYDPSPISLPPHLPSGQSVSALKPPPLAVVAEPSSSNYTSPKGKKPKVSCPSA